ncbi:MAG: glycosyltransferase family 4 protein [Acidobacteria bacterium]|nr:glycosyltransferase family 4 protein [Acidobacteriota bacterium]
MMRILVISNLYPPHHLGGYEMACREVVKGLSARGHEVRVLTSTYGLEKPAIDGEVYRWLTTDLEREPKPLARRALELLGKEARNQQAFKRVVKEFRPELVYFWNLANISVSLALSAQRMRLPVCYYNFDLWLTNWRSDNWLALWPPAPRRRAVRLASRAARSTLETVGILSSGVLDLRHVQFATHYLKRSTLEAGEPVAGAEVIQWGIEVEKFPYKAHGGEPARLLFVGQVVPHKGVHTALEALRILVQEHGRSGVTLTIAGGSSLPDYVSELRRFVQTHRLEGNVEFCGHVAHEHLPEVYRAHDILLFPSIIDEGLGLGILEAMASGLVVLGTASGGSAEILEHERTGLVFPKEDAVTCAAHVLRLIGDRGLFEYLRRNGRRMVDERFRVERAVDEIEHSLQAQLAEVARESLTPAHAPGNLP